MNDFKSLNASFPNVLNQLTDPKECKLLVRKYGVSIVHLDHTDTYGRGYNFFCERCRAFFPEEILNKKEYLKKVLRLQGIKI